MRKTESKTIGGVEYNVTQLGATAGRKVFTRLARVLGAAAGSQEPIAGLVSALDDETVTFLCDTFGPVTTVTIEGKKPQLSGIFEEHFVGRYGDMVKWLLFCFEVNFGSFLADLTELIQKDGSVGAGRGSP